MTHPSNNNSTQRESCSESSAIHGMRIEIPQSITQPNQRRAYAMAFRAAYHKKHIRFVAANVRFSIERGWKDGEFAYWADADREAAQMLAEEAATAHA